MAIDYVCGFECAVASTAGGPHWTSLNGTASFVTSGQRTGDRALRVNPSPGFGQATFEGLGAQVIWVMRTYVYFVTLPNVDCNLMTTAGTIGVGFKASDSKIYAVNSAVYGTTGVGPVTTGQWYRLEATVESTNGILQVQLDGVAASSLATGFSSSALFTVGIFGGLITAEAIFDDCAVAVGDSADYPIGAGYVKSYIPNADGTHNVAGANDFERSLTGTDITNSTTDAYELINDRPLPTTAVDFINGIAPPNSSDYVEWHYENSSEPSDPRWIEAMIIHHDAGGAGTNNFAVTIRDSTPTSLNIWTGTTNVGSTLTGKRIGFATLGGTMTTAQFNTLHSRIFVSDASPDVYLDAAMLEVEFPEINVATYAGIWMESLDVQIAE